MISRTASLLCLAAGVKTRRSRSCSRSFRGAKKYRKLTRAACFSRASSLLAVVAVVEGDIVWVL